MLDALAAALDTRRAEIIALAADETALYPAELEPEFDRMTGTLRLFAGVVREGSWVRAAIDHPAVAPAKSIGPNHDVRSMLVPLGPVAVFGASNFPLAYGVCGGDTASALAAGCPVVVKEHPAHPRLGRVLALLAREATSGQMQYILNPDPADYGVANALVQNGHVRAVGFTGSARGGVAVQNLALKRRYRSGIPDIIPVFAELGSCNVILVLRDAARNLRAEVVEMIAGSLLLRHGQQCTAPTVVMVAGYESAHAVFEELSLRFDAAPVRRLLSRAVADGFYAGVQAALGTGIVEKHTRLPTDDERAAMLSPPVLMLAPVVAMEDEPVMWQEIFGPALIIAPCHDLAKGYFHTPNSLAVSVIGDDDVSLDEIDEASRPATEEEFEQFVQTNAAQAMVDTDYLGSRREIAAYLQGRTGRLVFDGPPTGVRVAHGMVHGGPWPATNRPDTTAVGPRAIERWCRPVCWQNCPQELLPPELQDHNPRGIWRMVDGEWTREPRA